MSATLLFCLLTASPFIAWLGALDPAKAALGITVVGGAIVGLVVKLAVGIESAKRAVREAGVPKEAAPLVTAPAATSPQTVPVAEVQAAMAQRMATEAALLDTQLAIRRVRTALDDQVRDAAKAEGVLMAANVLAKAEVERLTAELAAARARIVELEKAGRDLVTQMARERAEPPSLPPVRKLRSVPPLPRGGGRER